MYSGQSAGIKPLTVDKTKVFQPPKVTDMGGPPSKAKAQSQPRSEPRAEPRAEPRPQQTFSPQASPNPGFAQRQQSPLPSPQFRPQQKLPPAPLLPQAPLPPTPMRGPGGPGGPMGGPGGPMGGPGGPMGGPGPGRSPGMNPGRMAPQNTLPQQPGFRSSPQPGPGPGGPGPSPMGGPMPNRGPGMPLPGRSPAMNNPRGPGPGLATSPMNSPMASPMMRQAPAPVVEMTRIKCYYKDKRLVEIPKDNCAFFDFKQRVESKCAAQGLQIKFQASSGDMSNIGNQSELDYALSDTNGDLTIYVNRPGEVNTFIPKVEPPPQEDDWQECYTDEGDLYYFNMTTQESSWDPPVIKPKATPIATPMVKTVTAVTKVASASTSNSNLVTRQERSDTNGYGGYNVPMKQMPVAQVKQNRSDWMECFTDDGEKYYFNMVTEESSWDPPT